MKKHLSEDLKYLREDKDLPEKPKMTENLEEKYPDKKKPFPEYTAKANLAYLANEKTAGGLLDRVQKQQEGTQQISGLLQGAIDKFRSLVFEVAGSDKVIEVAKTGDSLDMKVYENKDTPTPSSEKKFKMPEFLNFFMQKLAPRNYQQVAQELSNKGVAEVNKGTFISVKIALKKKAYRERCKNCNNWYEENRKEEDVKPNTNFCSPECEKEFHGEQPEDLHFDPEKS